MSQEVKKKEEVGSEAEPTKKEMQEQHRQQALQQKQAAQDLAAYKKRLRDSVELKRLQVEELDLNIAYFEVSKQWKALQPEIQEYEAQERAEQQKQQEEYEKMIKKANEQNVPEGGSMPTPKGMEEKKEDTPPIILPKTGKARPKK